MSFNSCHVIAYIEIVTSKSVIHAIKHCMNYTATLEIGHQLHLGTPGMEETVPDVPTFNTHSSS